MLDDSEDEEINRRPQRLLFDLERNNFFTCDSVFRQYFRIDREVFEQVEYLIGPHLAVSARNISHSIREQILTTLHFLGNGAQYHLNGLAHNISKATVCRCIHKVCELIAVHLMSMFVRWPNNCRLIERQFYQKAQFPHVRGALDGTLIYIDAPSDQEPLFVSRNNKHAINVLLVSGPSNEFFYVSAKSPGSFHDARALRISSLWHKWEQQQWRPDNDDRAILLGDSAYPLTQWLMPPVIRQVNANIRRLAQAVPLFLSAHRKTRFIVECSIGILKEEYPCLNHFRFKSVERICIAVYACVTLHNMQNRFHRGSYRYDQTLNQMANRNDGMAPFDIDENSNASTQAGILMQRNILQEFALRL